MYDDDTAAGEDDVFDDGVGIGFGDRDACCKLYSTVCNSTGGC